MQSVRFVLRTVCPRLIRAKKQSVRFVIRTVCPRLINPYDLSTPNQGTPYNLSPYGLSEANQQSVRFVIRTVCLQTNLVSSASTFSSFPPEASSPFQPVDCVQYPCCRQSCTPAAALGFESDANFCFIDENITMIANAAPCHSLSLL